MLPCHAATGVIVTANSDPRLVFQHMPPTHEMGALRQQMRQLALVGQIVAIAQQNQAISFHAVFVIGMPVVRQFLNRQQQIMAVFGTRPL